MIYCSQCGTQNRDGSKFCSNCAARLAPPSGLICPMCSTPNPVETVFCNNCGARLVPLTGGSDTARRDSAPPIKGLSLPAKPAAPPATEETASDEPVTKEKIQDWLAKLRAEPPTEDEPSSLLVEKSEQPIEPAPTSAPEPIAPPPPAEPLPTWVKEITVDESPPETIAPSDYSLKEEIESLPAETREQLPDWLKDLGAQTRLPEQAAEPEPIEPEPVYQPTSSADELPDWLKSQVPEIAPSESEPRTPASTFDMLRDEEPLHVSQETEPSTSAPTFDIIRDEELPRVISEPEVEQEPSFESLFQPKEPETAEPASLVQETESEEPFELPSFLSESDAESALATQFKEPEIPTIEPVRPEEIPAWIAQFKPREDISLEPPPPQSSESQEEMSDWLRTPAPYLTPQPVLPEASAGEVELGGPLANLRGVLPLAIAMAEPHTMTPLAPPERKDGAHLFEEILNAPSAETAPLPRRRARRGMPTLRTLIYFFLALAVIVPFFVPFNVSGASLKITRTPAAEFYDTIQQLPADSTVLVAFDYDPSVAGEMDLLATGIVRHLAQRRIKFIALSTLETGPNIAQRVLNSAEVETPDYKYGAQYLNLGYLPGHEAGVARLANQGLPLNGIDWGKRQIVGQYPIAANVQTIGSIALTIELAGAEEPLKIWVEQFQPRVNAKIAVGASAAVEPKARTYKDAKQLVALVSGPIGAAQYEILTNQTGQAVTRIIAQSAAQLVLIFVVIAGNVAYWLSRLAKRKEIE